MIYLKIYWEFLKIGLFAFGGGYSILPFLYPLSKHFGWFPMPAINQMVAISSICPGPTGISLATLCGLHISFFGAITAVIGIITPSLVIIILIAKGLKKYKENYLVNAILYGLKPCALALLVSVLIRLMKMSIILHGEIPVVIFIIIAFLYKKMQSKPFLLLICAALLSILLQFSVGFIHNYVYHHFGPFWISLLNRI